MISTVQFIGVLVRTFIPLPRISAPANQRAGHPRSPDREAQERFRQSRRTFRGVFRAARSGTYHVITVIVGIIIVRRQRRKKRVFHDLGQSRRRWRGGFDRSGTSGFLDERVGVSGSSSAGYRQSAHYPPPPPSYTPNPPPSSLPPTLRGSAGGGVYEVVRPTCDHIITYFL